MKFKANISLKLAGFLLAICVPPFLLYQILTFSIVRDTMVEMATKNSMNLLVDQEVYLAQQLDHIEDLLRNISAIEEIKQAIRRADAVASSTPTSSRSSLISTIDQISTQTRIGTILSGYSSLNGLVSLDIFSTGGQHYHVGDTLSSRYVNTTRIKQLIRESRQAGSNIYWHGIRGNINNSSDQNKVIVASKTLWDTRQTIDAGTPRPLGTLLVNYDPTALYLHLDRLEMGRGSQLLVVDRARRLLYHPDAALIGQPVAPSLGQLLTGESGSLTVDLPASPHCSTTGGCRPRTGTSSAPFPVTNCWHPCGTSPIPAQPCWQGFWSCWSGHYDCSTAESSSPSAPCRTDSAIFRPSGSHLTGACRR